MALAPAPTAVQPVSDVEIVAVNVSSPSTSSSDAIGIVRSAVWLNSATVTVDGVVPVSAADAAAGSSRM